MARDVIDDVLDKVLRISSQEMSASGRRAPILAKGGVPEPEPTAPPEEPPVQPSPPQVVPYDFTQHYLEIVKPPVQVEEQPPSDLDKFLSMFGLGKEGQIPSEKVTAPEPTQPPIDEESWLDTVRARLEKLPGAGGLRAPLKEAIRKLEARQTPNVREQLINDVLIPFAQWYANPREIPPQVKKILEAKIPVSREFKRKFGVPESRPIEEISPAEVMESLEPVFFGLPGGITIKAAAGGLKTLGTAAEIAARAEAGMVKLGGEGKFAKGFWDSLKLAERVKMVKQAGLEGKVGSKAFEKLSASEKTALSKVVPEAKAIPPEVKPPAIEAPLVKEGAGVIPPVKPPEVPPTTVGEANPIEEALSKFGKALSGSKTEEAFTAQREMWAKDRATRSARFAELLAKERESGVDARTAIERATAAFKGEYARTPTGLTLPVEVRDAAYSKIIKVISEDATIPPTMKSFEIASTTTALDNALVGRPIPNIVGIKGGSAKSRLLRIFDSNPEIKKIIENPEEMQRRLLESMPPSGEVDAVMAEYLRNLPTIGKQGAIGIEEPLLNILKKPLIQADKPVTGVNIPFRTKAQIEQETLELTLSLMGEAKGASQAVVPPLKYIKQFSMLPPSNRTQIINTLKTVGFNIVDALGIPKSVKFAFDMSMMARQLGISGARHPISWLKTWKPYFRAMRSEAVAMEFDTLIRTEPTRIDAIKKLGLDLYETRKGASYWDRPESMASKLAEKYIPGIRMSNRGAAVAVNYYLTDVGKQAVKVLDKMGVGQEEYKAMGSLLNELVGRGEMPNFLKGTAGDILNKLLSSPRYTASRFEWPVKLISSSKAVRQEAWSTLFSWAGLNTAILGAAIAAGWGRVEGDPRSSDVIKLRIGNKHIDLWQGSAQILRLGAQLAPYVDDEGKVDWTMGSRKTASGKVIPVPRADVLARFAQSKESPGVGAIVSILTGKNYIGEKIDFSTLRGWATYIKDTFAPVSLEEIGDAYVTEGLFSAAISVVESAGVGVSTYPETPSVQFSTIPEIKELGVELGDAPTTIKLPGDLTAKSVKLDAAQKLSFQNEMDAAIIPAVKQLVGSEKYKSLSNTDIEGKKLLVKQLMGYERDKITAKYLVQSGALEKDVWDSVFSYVPSYIRDFMWASRGNLDMNSLANKAIDIAIKRDMDRPGITRLRELSSTLPDNWRAASQNFVLHDNPELDAKMNLWGESSMVKSIEALTLLKKYADELGVPYQVIPSLIEKTPEGIKLKKIDDQQIFENVISAAPDYFREYLWHTSGWGTKDLKPVIHSLIDAKERDKGKLYKYDQLSPNEKERYRALNPDVDVALNIWGRVNTVKSAKALTMLRERAKELGIPFEALPISP